MTIIESIYRALQQLPIVVENNINFTLAEMQLAAKTATVSGTPGVSVRDLYIGGNSKEVDFSFKILYKLDDEETESRVFANKFLESTTEFLRNNKVDLGEGRTFIRCVQTSGINKSGVNSSNAQEWTVEYTLTYQEF